MSRLPASMAANPKRVLAAVLLVTLAFGVAARDVRLDNNFAALFANDSDAAQFRQEHRDRWGPEDGLLVAVVQAGDPASSAEVPDLIEQMTDDTLAGIPELDRVESVTTVEVLGTGPDGAPQAGPAFGAGSPFTLPLEERLRLVRESTLGASNLVSADGQTFLVVGVLAPEYDSHETVVGPAQAFQTRVEELAGTSSVDVTTNFSGVAYTRVAAIDLMQSDLMRLSPLSTLMMALILFAVFRRPAAVLGPLLAIGASIIVTAGVVGLAGDDLNQVTIIFPILMMGVVVSSSTHLIHRFYRERGGGRDAVAAGQVVLERLSAAAFIAAVTTAIGFASLIMADMRILHEFGLYLAAGVLAAFVLQMCIVPCVLIIADSQPHPSYGEAPRPAGAGGLTERYARWMLRPTVAVGALVVGLGLVVGSVLIARTAVYDYALTDMLSPDHPVSQGNAIIDGELNGVWPVEISFQGSPGSLSRPEVLEGMVALADWLDREHGIEAVSLAAAVEEVATVGSDADADDIGLWTDPTRIDAALAAVRTFRDGEYARTLITDDSSYARMHGFTPERGGRYIVDLAKAFDREARAVFPDATVTARMTGEAPVAYDGMNSLTAELVVSAILAMGMIVIAILMVFRNGWLTLASVLPNVVPVVAALGVYRLTNDVLDPLPGVVLCIATGLAADDTIHLINRWRELRNADPTLRADEALVAAVVSVRKAMVTSTVVLVAGFLTLRLSGFAWNAQLGSLGGIVLVLALASDLLFGVAGLALIARRIDRESDRRMVNEVLDAQLSRCREKLLPDAPAVRPSPSSVSPGRR